MKKIKKYILGLFVSATYLFSAIQVNALSCVGYSNVGYAVNCGVYAQETANVNYYNGTLDFWTSNLYPRTYSGNVLQATASGQYVLCTYSVNCWRRKYTIDVTNSTYVYGTATNMYTTFIYDNGTLTYGSF